MRLKCDIGAHVPGDRISECLDSWFPVIELHNNVFRGAKPTIQELVAGNAMHAGFVAPPAPEHHSITELAQARIQVEIDRGLAELMAVAEVPGGPLGSLCWLASSLAMVKESLKAGDIILTGSPGRLIPVGAECSIMVECGGQRTELFVGEAGGNEAD